MQIYVHKLTLPSSLGKQKDTLNILNSCIGRLHRRLCVNAKLAIMGDPILMEIDSIGRSSF